MLRPDHPAMTLLLGALVAIAPLAMDIYLPSMPAMTRALAATPEQVQLTISVYMLGWGAAQLFAGPMSDRFGRKPALLGGLAAFTLASIACAMSTQIGALVAARFVQAVAMATVVVIPRAIVRDLYEGDRAAHTLSTMMLVLSVAPVGAPVLGAELHLRFGWQASFVLVAIYGAVALAAVLLTLPETLARSDPTALELRRMIGNWMLALRSRRLVGFLSINAFATCGLFAFLAGSAFVFVDGLESGVRGYALYFGVVMVGNFIGAWLARRLVIRIGLERVIARGSVLLVVAGVSMAALAWFGIRHPLAITLPMLLYMLAYMWTVPQSTAGALTPFPQIAGSIASLMSFTQFVVAAGFAYVVGVAYDGTPRPMATAIAIAALGVLAAYRGLVVVRAGR
jgi:MFS transporter, DHA1 family, multidrug resistance protein